MADGLRIAVLGAGNMGAALVGGMLRVGIATPETLIATVRTAERAGELSSRFGIRVVAGGNLEASEWADLIVIAVKPPVVPRIIEEIRWGLRQGNILVSLAAAVSIASIEQVLGRPFPVFRAMPNIPVLVDEGATCLAANSAATAEDKELVARLFQSVGVVCHVEEDQLHAVTAMSGSGPAYIYMVIEGLIAGGLKMGLPHAVATRLAEQTVLGAAKLVRETGEHPAVLKDQVITPGGVTIAAVHELERHGLRAMLISAVETATRHSRHLAGVMADKLKPSE